MNKHSNYYLLQKTKINKNPYLAIDIMHQDATIVGTVESRMQIQN